MTKVETLVFVLGGSDKEMRISFDVILDDSQIIEYILDLIAGSNALDIGSLYVYAH